MAARFVTNLLLMPRRRSGQVTCSIRIIGGALWMSGGVIRHLSTGSSSVATDRMTKSLLRSHRPSISERKAIDLHDE